MCFCAPPIHRRTCKNVPHVLSFIAVCVSVCCMHFAFIQLLFVCRSSFVNTILRTTFIFFSFFVACFSYLLIFFVVCLSVSISYLRLNRTRVVWRIRMWLSVFVCECFRFYFRLCVRSSHVVIGKHVVRTETSILQLCMFSSVICVFVLWVFFCKKSLQYGRLIRIYYHVRFAGAATHSASRSSFARPHYPSAFRVCENSANLIVFRFIVSTFVQCVVYIIRTYYSYQLAIRNSLFSIKIRFKRLVGFIFIFQYFHFDDAGSCCQSLYVVSCHGSVSVCFRSYVSGRVPNRFSSIAVQWHARSQTYTHTHTLEVTIQVQIYFLFCRLQSGSRVSLLFQQCARSIVRC